MRLQPKRAGLDGRIRSGLPPPLCFVPAAVQLAMMAPTQRDRELITNFAPEGSMLRKSQVMGIRRPSSANQAWLFGHVSNVIAVACGATIKVRIQRQSG
jgi:hypothetical protein